MNQTPNTIKAQFQLYLDKIGLNKSNISDIQYKETRKAFYAGAALTLLNMRDNISELSEEEGIEEFDKLINESKEFFKSE